VRSESAARQHIGGLAVLAIDLRALPAELSLPLVSSMTTKPLHNCSNTYWMSK